MSPGAGDNVRPIPLVVPGKPLPQHLSVLMECVKVKSPHALFSRALEEALDDLNLLGRKGRKELLPQATVATSTSQAPDYIGERAGKHRILRRSARSHGVSTS